MAEQQQILWRRDYASNTSQHLVLFTYLITWKTLLGTQPACLHCNFWCPPIFDIQGLKGFSTVTTEIYSDPTCLETDRVTFCWRKLIGNLRMLYAP